MGYYASAQIEESMVGGVPAVTYASVQEFITPEMEESGLILTDLAGLEQTIEFYLTHPDELAKKRDKARSSILRLHDNKKLATKLIGFYRQLLDKSDSSGI
jgi:glycosyltransferase involved in cell wall biosynthesis